MALDTPAALRLVRDFAPAQLLTDALGWAPCPTPPHAAAAATHGGPRLVPLAAHRGRTALHHRTPLGGTFPGHAERRAVRAQALRAHADPLIVFTDALHTVQLWQWAERAPGRPPLYREHCHRPDDEGRVLLRRLATLDVPASGAPDPVPAAADREAVEAAVLATLLRRVRHRCAAAFRAGGVAERVLARDAPLPARALALIEESDDPALLRATWRALTTLAVLDPACGRGERLLAAADALSPLYDACVERIQGWLNDLDRTRPARRPEHSAALRAAVMRADLPTDPVARAARIRGAILRDNLFGAGGTAQACTAPATTRGLDLRSGDVRLGYARAAEIGDARLREDLEILARAAAVAAPAQEDAVFAARQAALRAALDRRLAREHGIDVADEPALQRWLAGRRPLHACLEWPAVAARGGFDLVLATHGGSRVRERRAGFGVAHPTPAERLCYLPRAAAAYPTRLAAALGEAAPALLTLRGDPALLAAPQLALFASTEVPAGIALQTLALVRALREAGTIVVSGFQSPLERACLDVLLDGAQPIVVVAARGISEMRLPAAWRAPLAAGRLLVASGFASRVRRPTRELAAARNRYAAALAAQQLVAYATPGGKTHRLAADLLRSGTRVYTLDNAANTDLLLLGAAPIGAAPTPMPRAGCAG